MNGKGKYLIVLLVIIVFLTAMGINKVLYASAVVQTDKRIEKSLSSAELVNYDGTDPSKPIYLALDGYVYDVTDGREYYETGGSYHYLAGRDSSIELHVAGGDIIKRKYPVIARFSP